MSVGGTTCSRHEFIVCLGPFFQGKNFREYPHNAYGQKYGILSYIVPPYFRILSFIQFIPMDFPKVLLRLPEVHPMGIK